MENQENSANTGVKNPNIVENLDMEELPEGLNTEVKLITPKAVIFIKCN